ncbi:MAG: hypothetical protein R6X08_13085 [Desulfosalsimonadaceae bacterium]
MEPAEEIIQTLARELSCGWELSPGVVHFLDSTFGPVSAEELKDILTAPDNCEADTAVELIFFPDAALQEKIEPIAEQTDFSEKTICDITERLCAKKITASLRLPDGRGEASLSVPDAAVCQLVSRLNLTVCLAPEISRSITENSESRDDALRIRVRLKNARIPESFAHKNFLCSLIRNLPRGSEEFWEILELAVYLLEHIKPEADIYQALMEHKKRLIQAINATLKNREALAANTVEALIMQGTNISPVCVDTALRTIDRIDRISLLIYGTTEFLPLPGEAGSSMDLAVQNSRDLGSITRLLSSY